MKLQLCLLALCLAAVCQAAVPTIDRDCVTGPVSGIDTFFPQKFYVDGSTTKSKVDFAQGFSVEYFDTYKLATVTTDAGTDTYCLYQCGTAAPAATQVPKGTKFFSIPLSSSSVLDTTAVAFLAELGLLDRVNYVTPYSVAPCMQKLSMPKADGGCGLAAVSPMGDKSDATNKPLLQQADGVASIWTFSNIASVPTLASKVITFPATADPGTLRRAEWLKFVALFYNKEPEANARFNAIADSYNATRAAALKAAGTSKPLVAWAGAMGGMVSISLAAYKNEYITDAGGVPLKLADIRAVGGAAVQCMDLVTYGPGPCSATSTTAMINATTAAGAAALRKVLADVEVLIDESYINSPRVTAADVEEVYGFKASDSLPFLTKKRVFRLDAHIKLAASATDSVTLEWYETAVARPDLALADFVVAITPDALKGTVAPAYARNVATEKSTVVDATQCKALTGCTVAPQPICPYVYKDCTTGEFKYVTADNRCGTSCTSTPATPIAPTTAPATPNTTAKANTTTNAAPAMRPLLTVFALIVALIEALIHLF